MVSRDHDLSVRRQCGLLPLARTNLYYQPKGESAENLRFMGIIDKQFLQTPWYGSRQMARYMQAGSQVWPSQGPSIDAFDAIGDYLAKVITGVTFKDGIETKQDSQIAA